MHYIKLSFAMKRELAALSTDFFSANSRAVRASIRYLNDINLMKYSLDTSENKFQKVEVTQKTNIDDIIYAVDDSIVEAGDEMHMNNEKAVLEYIYNKDTEEDTKVVLWKEKKFNMDDVIYRVEESIDKTEKKIDIRTGFLVEESKNVLDYIYNKERCVMTKMINENKDKGVVHTKRYNTEDIVFDDVKIKEREAKNESNYTVSGVNDMRRVKIMKYDFLLSSDWDFRCNRLTSEWYYLNRKTKTKTCYHPDWCKVVSRTTRKTYYYNKKLNKSVWPEEKTWF